MKDWKEWFKQAEFIDEGYEDQYQAYKARLIDEGYIVANPKKWVRPLFIDVHKVFIDKLLDEKTLTEIVDLAERFFDHWDSVDWMDGKKRVKSVNGRINTWIKNNEKFKRNDSQRFNGTSAADKIAASITSRS